MKKIVPVLCVGLAGLGLGGCEDVYAPSVRYLVRQDPLVMVSGSTLSKEELYPDRPGQLPLLRLDAIFKDEYNPLYPDRDKIASAEKMRDPTRISAADRQKIEEMLEKLFGTPAKPTVRGYEAEAKKVVELPTEAQAKLKLDDKTLEAGSKLYRIHCVHCHGVPGDGRGPTSQWVNPHPRDFRQGLFKFQSVDQASSGKISPPRREDLLRTLEYGLEGSAMPAFTLLSHDDRENLVSYVIHLALRGRTEFDTLKDAFVRDDKGSGLKVGTNDEGNPHDLAAYVGESLEPNLKNWLKAQDAGNVIRVPSFPYADKSMDELKKSVHRGHQMFTGKADADAGDDMQKWVKAANCVSCHTDYGRQANFRWDDWGTLVRPNNLLTGVYRGGRRPLDFYNRIHSGINGAGMAPFGGPGVLPPAAIWDLVNFVRTVPYPTMRESLGIRIPS